MDRAQYVELEGRLAQIEGELALCARGSLDDYQEAMVDELRNAIMSVVDGIHSDLIRRLDNAVQEVTTTDEISTEICEICEVKVTFCTCQRCLDCGTLYDEETAITALNDDGLCKDCTEI